VTKRFTTSDVRARIAAKALRLLLGKRYADRFAIELWDGSRIEPATLPEFTISVHSPGALRFAIRPPIDLNAGRAFAAGILSCEGNVEAAVDLLYESIAALKAQDAFRAFLLLRRLPTLRAPEPREAHLSGRLHSVARDRQAIGFHYDQPVPFYRAILGDSMVYSCGYYDDGISSLANAQNAKIDYVLRKLRVKPGDRLLDVGCGWGTLVLSAARRFGANVLGITLSHAQHVEGNRRIAEAQLGDMARIELIDYRDIAQSFIRQDCEHRNVRARWSR
jgi:cyclopropane-fatty-acyl-phospholipid synthase